jgi:hypothetical protein
MPKPKQTDADRLAALTAEISRLQARAKELEASKRAKEARTAQRRAFLIGEAIAAEGNLPQPFKRYLAEVIDRQTKRSADRELLQDLLADLPPGSDRAEAAA